MSESFKTDAGYKLTVHEGWDRDEELQIELEYDCNDMFFYLNKSDITRLRNILSIQLGE